MKVSTRSINRILHVDLQSGASRRRVSHLLTKRLKTIRLERCKKLVKRFTKNEHLRILFSNEKIFTTEEEFNRQNDQTYAKNCIRLRIKLRELRAVITHLQHLQLWFAGEFLGTESQKFIFVRQGLKWCSIQKNFARGHHAFKKYTIRRHYSHHNPV